MLFINKRNATNCQIGILKINQLFKKKNPILPWDYGKKKWKWAKK